MSIFLGHPVYSLSVLLSTLILSTGIGSFLSEQLPLQSRTRLIFWGVITGVYIFLLPFCLGPLFTAFNAAALGTRIALCVAFIAPAGLLLGFGFPTGMRLVSSIDPKPTPWFWGINGAAGVLASIVAVTLSLALGISATLVLGAVCYFLLVPVSLALLQTPKIAARTKTEKPQNIGRKAAKTPARSH
jgi:MFS family permease